jgi:putative oxidoreductase
MDNRALFILARILIPIVFVGLGVERLLVAAGVLAGPPVSTGAAALSALELIAGLLIVVGWKVRWIAGLLAVFIVVDVYLAHAFWTYPAAERHGQLLHFLKNLSTLGGLLLLIWADAREASRSKSGFS